MPTVVSDRVTSQDTYRDREPEVAGGCEIEIWLDDPRLSQVSCKVFDDHVELTGSVTNFRAKQLAQELLRQDSNPRQIVNRIQVVR